jgi:UDP-glucuronate 4-epimerase
VDSSGPILVTGAAGFIGSHVTRALLARGQRVVGVDNFDPFYPRARKELNLQLATRGHERAFEFHELDICDARAMDALMSKHRFVGVLHLGAKANPRLSVGEPVAYLHANVIGTGALLGACAKHAIGRIIIASSSSVYGNNPNAPFSEEQDVSHPISPYAASKRACELIGYTHHHLTKQPVGMLRFFTVYGPGQRPDLGLSLFIEKISRGQTISVFGDGSMARDCTYVDDCVAGILSAFDRVDRFGYRIWNLGNHTPVSVMEMIRAVEKAVGKSAKIEHAPLQPGDVKLTYADLTRSARELDYHPKTKLEQGVAKQYAFAREHLGL